MAGTAQYFGDDLPLAFVDIETTGGQAAWHRITEIAVIGAHGDQLDFEWQTLVNPGVAIPPSITALTGIDNELVASAPAFADIANELRERLDGRLFLAHNVRFDYGFIRGEFQRLGLRWQAPQACTARLSRRLFPEYARHNLDSIIERHRIHCASRHRAMPDAAALWQFWQQLRAQKPLPELDRALQATLQHSALPPQLSTQLAGELPESTGVYCFYGAAGGAGDAAEALLYVGKANNLRERVLSHFSGAHRNAKSQRLTQQTQRIDWIETAGEWQALLHESELVQQQQPVYNRRLRGGEVFSWRFASDATAPELVSLAHGVPSTGDCFGLYRNARAARKALHTLAQEQQFCLKVLGLEPGPGSCFGYQLQRCRGACVGTEAPVRHALRLRLAWARSKLATWPFAGPVAVAEQARGGWFCLLVLDRFRYLGALRFELHDEALSDAELRNRCAALLRSANSAHFDADRYRIIVRLLRQRGARQRIVPLHSESVT